ncbi:cuticle protein AM1199 [Cherax quadricarinatus]|uniref:cuticle protein AM1199 n=1 Tax=Cherax quadricarinatus TaxID=27406 RepID=UPI0023791D5D|nr:cuticle protein AM1199-like [Cherax quadricarinatus]
MRTIVMLALLAVAAADKRPLTTYGAPGPAPSHGHQGPQIAIIRDDRVHPDAQGLYSLNLETEDGIVRQESGGPGGSQQGSVSFTFPDGQVFDLKFVADAAGYQPQSSFLPVAPEFPHPIPQFVLDQIAFAAQEDAARARGEVRSPSPSYGAPSK